MSQNTQGRFVAIALMLVWSAPVVWTNPARADSGSDIAEAAAQRSKQASTQRGGFQKHVLPVFRRHCVSCHGETKREGSLNLSSIAGVARGGDSGSVVVPGNLSRSLLWDHVHEGSMPPEGQPRLQKKEIQSIRDWIESGADAVSFARPRVSQHDVLPILHLRCVVCHGGRKREAELDLRTVDSMRRGGKSGAAIVPGKPEQSLLLRRVVDEQMPPRRRLVEASVKTMTATEVNILKSWISDGAPEWNPPAVAKPAAGSASDLWSLQPPRRQDVPELSSASRAINPVDTFVMQALHKKGWDLSPQADPQTLLRRVTMDLTGLPPHLALQDAYYGDRTPGAYERLVDRLLASPEYGERWARYWLDLAGYADSEGVTHQDSVRPHAYRYRDYVIRSMNEDKPYDRFLLEQLAGDELDDWENSTEISQAVSDNLVATGFLRMAPDGTWANITNFVPDRLDVITAELEILSSAVLGLTIKCARCHSHKFDPISQRDYYRIAAVFRGAYDQHDWLKPYQAKQFSSGPFGLRFLSQVPSNERNAWEARQQNIDRQIATVDAELNAVRDRAVLQIQMQKVDDLPEDVRPLVRTMLSTPKAQRTPKMKELARRFADQLKVDLKQLPKLSPEYRDAQQAAEKRKQNLASQRVREPKIRALWDRGSPSPTYLLLRGNYLTPGSLVEPGVPQAFANAQSYRVVAPRGPKGPTGRRLAFARWLTRDDHPLTARVIVNRLWKHHFGVGLVSTLDDFGHAGSKPSHPELLDWLALELIRGDWSLKKIQRLIVTSATYRQGSQTSPERMQQDPQNQWLSHMRVARLDAESLRDSLVYLAGRMNRRPFGTPDPVSVRADGLVVSEAIDGMWRRSVYLQQRRTQIPTLLENFDLPSMGPNCVDRPVSTVAPQALQLMNNARVHDWAVSFADTLIAQSHGNVELEIRNLFRHCLGRPPSDREFGVARDYYKQLVERWSDSREGGKSPASDPSRQALASLCHAMFNSAVFLFID